MKALGVLGVGLLMVAGQAAFAYASCQELMRHCRPAQPPACEEHEAPSTAEPDPCPTLCEIGAAQASLMLSKGAEKAAPGPDGLPPALAAELVRPNVERPRAFSSAAQPERSPPPDIYVLIQSFLI